ncbi:hypothetical protein F2P47_17540, partial [Parvibaculum sedimenti]
MTVQYIRSSSGELSFDVHQHFHAVTSPASKLRYTIVPTGGKQARFAGRVAVQPMIDLSAYRQKAVIDWLEIKVFLRDKTQGVSGVLPPHYLWRRDLRSPFDGRLQGV